MMRSMFTGVAGLRTHQLKMDVIGNNISNVNTVGFKAGSVTFKEIFTQTMQGASAPNADTGRGGTNPMQVGLGVAVASIDNVMKQGAAQTTDNPLDMMINGSSFFIVGDGSGTYFTRAGAFRLDEAGDLANPDGFKVMGWPSAPDPAHPGQQIISKGKVGPLAIKSPENLYINPVATKNAQFVGNLNMEEGKAAGGILKTIDFYDTLGNHYKVDITFNYNETDKKWEFAPADTMTRNEKDTIPFAWNHNDCKIEFDEYGNLVAVDPDTPPNKSFIEFNITSPNDIKSAFETIKLDFKGVTQFKETTSIVGSYLDGCAPGDLQGFSIGPDGIISGSYSNGMSKKLGQIAVADFKNPAGLEKIGNNLFQTTPNSGGFDGIGVDPTSGGGSIMGGTLEMSNVDLAKEFTDMITTQRGFQANSKVITTSDEMLQELVRLK